MEEEENKTYQAIGQVSPDGEITVLSEHKTEDAAARSAQKYANLHKGKICAWVEVK